VQDAISCFLAERCTEIKGLKIGRLNVTSVVCWDGYLDEYIILPESAQDSHKTIPVELRDIKEICLLTAPMMHTVKTPFDFISDVSAVAE
jgi:hypothetical protein